MQGQVSFSGHLETTNSRVMMLRFALAVVAILVPAAAAAQEPPTLAPRIDSLITFVHADTSAT